jgi:hypothetical protein
MQFTFLFNIARPTEDEYRRCISLDLIKFDYSRTRGNIISILKEIRDLKTLKANS